MLLAPRSSLTVCLLQKRKKELSDSVEGDGVSCYHPAWTWGECRTSLFGPTCPLTFRHGGPKFVLPLMFSKWKEQIRPWQVWSSPWSVQLLILCLPERSRMSGTLAKFRKNERILPPLPSSCSIETFTLGEDPYLAFYKCSQLISNLECSITYYAISVHFYAYTCSSLPQASGGSSLSTESVLCGGNSTGLGVKWPSFRPGSAWEGSFPFPHLKDGNGSTQLLMLNSRENGEASNKNK